MWVIGKASRRPRRFARATGGGFPRLSGGVARGSRCRHRHATRSWPKTLGSRLYESLSTRLGITAQVGQATYAETPPSLAMVDTSVALYGAAIRLTSQR